MTVQSQLDRLKKSFKRLMSRMKSTDATFVRDGQSDKTLPVILHISSDQDGSGYLKNMIVAKFYAIEGDSDLEGVANLKSKDVLTIDGKQYAWSGEIIEKNKVSITAAFDYHELPFRENQ